MMSFEHIDKELQKEVHKAIKHLLRQFHEAEEMENVITKASEKVTKDDVKKLSWLYRHLAHEETEIAEEEEEILGLLEKLKKFISKSAQQQEEQFHQQLDVAAAHLKVLASFNNGELAKALAACQDDFNIAEHKEEWEKLETVLVNLVQWIKTNAALLKLMEEWSEGLKGK